MTARSALLELAEEAAFGELSTKELHGDVLDALANLLPVYDDQAISDFEQLVLLVHARQRIAEQSLDPQRFYEDNRITDRAWAVDDITGQISGVIDGLLNPNRLPLLPAATPREVETVPTGGLL